MHWPKPLKRRKWGFFSSLLQFSSPFSIYLYSYNINPFSMINSTQLHQNSQFPNFFPDLGRNPWVVREGFLFLSILEIESLPNLIPYIQTLIKHANTVGNPRLPSSPLSFPFQNPGLYIFFKIIHQSSQFLLLINCLYLNHPDLTFFFHESNKNREEFNQQFPSSWFFTIIFFYNYHVEQLYI